MEANKQQTTEEMYKSLMDKGMSIQRFEFEFSTDFKNFLARCMRSTSLIGTGIPLDSYDNMISFKRDFVLAEIPAMMNIILGSTPKELDMDIGSHFDKVKNLSDPIRIAWLDQEEVLSKKIQAEVQAKANISKNVPEHKKLIIPQRKPIIV